jgi:hypothetical protein
MLSPTAAGGDRVEETDDPGLAVRFEGLSPAGPPGKARQEGGTEQQRDRDHVGDRVDPQGVVRKKSWDRAAESAEISPAAPHYGSGDRDHQEVAKRDVLEPDRTGTVRSRRRSAGWQQLCRPPGNADALDLLSEPACHDALPHG